MKRKVVISALVLSVAGTGVLASSAFAQTTTPTRETLIQRLADKFNLNANDVKSVFDQFHSDRVAARDQKLDDFLTQAVKDGKITDAQKTLIENKRKELQDNRQATLDALKNKTPEERRAYLKQEKQALQDWAKQNNIDLKYLLQGAGTRMHRVIKGK